MEQVKVDIAGLQFRRFEHLINQLGNCLAKDPHPVGLSIANHVAKSDFGPAQHDPVMRGGVDPAIDRVLRLRAQDDDACP